MKISKPIPLSLNLLAMSFAAKKGHQAKNAKELLQWPVVTANNEEVDPKL